MTLLIAESVGSEKFKVAKELGIPIVKPTILEHLRSRHVTVEQYHSVSFLSHLKDTQTVFIKCMHRTNDLCNWI